MLAKDLITDFIPAVSGSDTVRRAMERMAEYRVIHLPVVAGTDYIGLITETDLGEVTDSDCLLDAFLLRLLNLSVLEDQHIYEVIDLISRYELTLLPAITTSKEYKGCITLPALVKGISSLTAAGQPGAILVLSLAPKDYSPTILSRIIEDNNAKMISLYAIPDPNGPDLTVTIKVNTQEISAIVRSFDRFGYSVKSYYLASKQLDDFYRSRYEEFMKYMNT